MMRTRCSVSFLLAVAACDAATGIPFPSTAVRFTPPSIYREWWALTEACSGREASFAAVSWYVVPGAATIPETRYNGYFYSAGNRIVLAGAEEAQSDGELVRHEMLHAIIGKGGHPREMFVVRCGGVVACIDDCLVDGGPAPPADPGSHVVPPSAIEVTVSVVPTAPSSATWDGYFMMFIHARNRSNYPVVVQFEQPAAAGFLPGFSYRLEGTAGGSSYDMSSDAPEVARFAAGETKQFIFDFHNVPGSYRYDLAPGTWTFNGAFGDVWAASPPVVAVGP